MYRVFLVEDEAHLNRVLTAYLQEEGWTVRSFPDGESARGAIQERPDLWVLDIMLPGHVDGYQLLREIKADRPLAPVIFISARDAEIDRVVGLELGSDDYVAKPFLPRELVVRSRKMLERVYGLRDVSEEAEGQPYGKWLLSPYLIDERSRTVTGANGTTIELTTREFDLLCYLTRHAGQVLSRDQVLMAVWGRDFFGSERVVDDLVRRLRRRLPEMRLETVYGYGYRMVQG